MSITVGILTGGTNNHTTSAEEANGLGTDFFSEGVVGAITATSGVAPMTGSFAVNAQDTPDATVEVSAGTAYVTATPSSQGSQLLRVVNSAAENVAISANSSGSTKYDHLYISIDAANAADPAVGADDVATLVTSRSTSASTDDGTPPTYGFKIAVVTVANGFSTITDGNIAEARTVGGPTPADNSVTSEKLSATVAFKAYASASTSAGASAWTKVALATEAYDYGSDFASSTFTAPVAGVYNFNAAISIIPGASGETYIASLYKNGAEWTRGDRVASASTTEITVNVNDDILLAANDTVELYVNNGSGGSKTVQPGQSKTRLAGHLVGRV